MFGKKKSDVAEVNGFHCGVCGAICLDQFSFERHVGLAHTGSETSKTANKGHLTGSEKKN